MAIGIAAFVLVLTLGSRSGDDAVDDAIDDATGEVLRPGESRPAVATCGSVVAGPGPESATAQVLPPGPVAGVDPIESDGFEVGSGMEPRPAGATLGVFVDTIERVEGLAGCTVVLRGDTIVARFGEPGVDGRQLLHVSVDGDGRELRTLEVNGRRFPIDRSS